MSEEEYPIEIRLVLIGDYSVGKSSILNRYINNDFKSDYFSLTKYFYTKTIMLDNAYIKLIRWDPFVSNNYFYASHPGNIKADAFILVYDITDKKSFDRLKNYWFEHLKRNFKNDTGKIKYL